MAKKAVYHNQYLAVYVSQEDFKALLEKKSLDVPVYIGKVHIGGAWAVIKILHGAERPLKEAYILERKAVEAGRAEFKRQYPNYKTYAERQGRKQHGKG